MHLHDAAFSCYNKRSTAPHRPRPGGAVRSAGASQIIARAVVASEARRGE